MNIKLRGIILAYWILLPLVFFAYMFVFAAVNGHSVGTMLIEIPSITLTFLLSCVTLLQAYSIYRLTARENDQELLNQYLLFSMVQQLITANLIGVALLFFYRKALKNEAIESVTATNAAKFEVYLLMGIVGVLSVLVAVLTLIQ